MKSQELKRIIQEELKEMLRLDEQDHRTDKTFRPIAAALMTSFGSIEELKDLSAGAMDQIFTIIHEDLNS